MPAATDVIATYMQALFDQIKTDLNFGQGEVTMFTMDVPNVPQSSVPVMIALANQATLGDATTLRTMGVCKPTPNVNFSLENVIEPIGEAQEYFSLYEHRKVVGPATVTILQRPTHGTLRLVNEADIGTILESGGDPLDPAAAQYIYLPEAGYDGKDKAVALVEIGGIKIKVVYFFHAISGSIGNFGIENYCGKKGYHWKISSTIDADGNSAVAAVDYLPSTAGNAVDVKGSNFLSSFAADAHITLNVTNLDGAALAQTTGEGSSAKIALDANAAGHNWFIDPTPADNSEFLPTSNPNEWIAKIGSEAPDKMDMLSVLLHEYGHALGFEHSTNSHDFMATTLTPGVRRLPSADELALMAQLVADIKTDMVAGSNTPDTPQSPFPTLPLDSILGLALFGRLRNTRYGGVITAIDSAKLRQRTQSQRYYFDP